MKYFVIEWYDWVLHECENVIGSSLDKIIMFYELSQVTISWFEEKGEKFLVIKCFILSVSIFTKISLPVVFVLKDKVNFTETSALKDAITYQLATNSFSSITYWQIICFQQKVSLFLWKNSHIYRQNFFNKYLR